MATFKQYLQNRWYRGMSKDRAVAYPYQFQYGRNVNVRDEKGGVRLASQIELTDCATDHIIQIEPNVGEVLYALTYDSVNNECDLNQMIWSNNSYTLSSLTTLQNWRAGGNADVAYGPRVKKYRDGVFVANGQSTMLYYVNDDQGGPYVGRSAISIVGELGIDNITYGFQPHIRCVYNFADTFFLVAIGGILLRFQPLTNDVSDIANWKIIRYFGVGKDIVGLSQSGNYLRIYVTDGHSTECHYAQGTFDLEESGMVQTVRYEGVLIPDGLATDGVKDYGLFKTNTGLRLLEMDGYSYETIRETQSNFKDGNTRYWIFGDSETGDGVKVCWYNNTLYCSIPDEGIWTFTKESVGSHGWIWGGVIERGVECFNSEEYYTGGKVGKIVIVNGIMLTLIVNPFGTLASQDYWWLGFTVTGGITPYKYVRTPGYIVGNIYDGGCGSLFKKNVSTTLVCGNTIPQATDRGIIGLAYRYDRCGNSPILDTTFDSIKLIEAPGIYDSVFITSIQQSIGGKSTEDIGTTPRLFNKPRNTIEYFIILSVPMRDDGETTTVNDHISPILYEHNLIYEDSMRKYR